MSDTDEGSETGGLADHIRRALAHADGAIRCYLALLAAEQERRARAFRQQTLWMVALTGFALIGVGLFAVGIARYLESRPLAPGAGAMAVGGVMIAVPLVVLIVRWARGGK